MAIRFTDLYGFTIPDYYIYLYSAAGIIQMKMGCDLSSELIAVQAASCEQPSTAIKPGAKCTEVPLRSRHPSSE